MIRRKELRLSDEEKRRLVSLILLLAEVDRKKGVSLVSKKKREAKDSKQQTKNNLGWFPNQLIIILENILEFLFTLFIFRTSFKIS